MKYFVGLFIRTLIAFGCTMATDQLGAAQASKPEQANIRIDHDVLVEDQRLDFIFWDVLHGTGLHGGFDWPVM